jgi:hypothetical protein
MSYHPEGADKELDHTTGDGRALIAHRRRRYEQQQELSDEAASAQDTVEVTLDDAQLATAADTYNVFVGEQDDELAEQEAA